MRYVIPKARVCSTMHTPLPLTASAAFYGPGPLKCAFHPKPLPYSDQNKIMIAFSQCLNTTIPLQAASANSVKLPFHMHPQQVTWRFISNSALSLVKLKIRSWQHCTAHNKQTLANLLRSARTARSPTRLARPLIYRSRGLELAQDPSESHEVTKISQLF